MGIFFIIILIIFTVVETIRAILEGHFKSKFCLWGTGWECAVNVLGIFFILLIYIFIFFIVLGLHIDMSDKELIRGGVIILFNYLCWLFINAYEINKYIPSTLQSFFSRVFIFIISSLLLGFIALLCLPFSDEKTKRRR